MRQRENRQFRDFITSSGLRELVLVEVTSTEGSTYRKKGARKLVAPDGRSSGLISGGCLEGEIIQFALDMKDSKAHLSIDTRAEEDRLLGYATGCQGRIDLEFSRIEGTSEELIQRVNKSDSESLFVHLFGAGPDVEPLYELLQWMAWDFAFYTTKRDLYQQRVDQGWRVQHIDPQNICFFENSLSFQSYILMSHDYPTDLEVLKQVILQEPDYIGLLGPEKRKHKIIEDLGNIHSVSLSEKLKDKVFGPVGVSGVGMGEDAIALSIVTQLQQRLVVSFQ